MLVRRHSHTFCRSRSFKVESIGQNAMAMIGNLCFSLFVVMVLVFTIIAANYRPEDPLFHSSTKITNFLTSKSDATFKSDTSVVKIGDEFVINVTGADSVLESESVVVRKERVEVDLVAKTGECKIDDPINCHDTDVFLLLMKSAVEKFTDVHFYRFGKPVRGSSDSSCDMAWRFRPKEGKPSSFDKDYRSFTVVRSENCTLVVAGIGDYHSGKNAMKRKREDDPIPLPKVEETVDDAFPSMESDGPFSENKYLLYSEGGDRCKSMHQYLWSFMCMLGEARYLNRTLVMDLSLCLSKIYTSSGQDEEGKDFRSYFDFEHLKDVASVMDKNQFWSEWGTWQQKDGLTIHSVDSFRVTPMKLAGIRDTLIMRKFGSVEPDNFWYRVCEGDAESVIERPWRIVWKSRMLLDIALSIGARMNWDFDSVHVERGEKATNKEMWPNLDRDTSPDALLSALKYKIEDGRNLYVATNEPDTSFFDPLKDKYSTHFLDEHKDLWDSNSDWYYEMTKVSNGNPFEFDGYMRFSVDTEVFLRGKKQIETFNDLTKDCKDGVNTCMSPS